MWATTATVKWCPLINKMAVKHHEGVGDPGFIYYENHWVICPFHTGKTFILPDRLVNATTATSCRCFLWNFSWVSTKWISVFEIWLELHVAGFVLYLDEGISGRKSWTCIILGFLLSESSEVVGMVISLKHSKEGNYVQGSVSWTTQEIMSRFWWNFVEG